MKTFTLSRLLLKNDLNSSSYKKKVTDEGPRVVNLCTKYKVYGSAMNTYEASMSLCATLLLLHKRTTLPVYEKQGAKVKL